ncbi:LamG domain-containing protein [Neolewinella persica]|uniref:LamG domain-containing protein n=1 Tax=Neolewinella persica TaxID=70998 RepID=UPI00037C2839|nr:LamG domain-containing protein [Neolewinella persica]
MKNVFPPLLLLALLLTLGCGDDDGGIIDPPMEEPEPSSLGIGVLFHVPFSGNADDISSVGLAGTVTGATITTDRHGVANEAYRFDGVDDVINYGPAPDLAFGASTTYTMAAWVKLEDRGDASRNTIISKFNGGVAAGWYLAVNADEEIQAYRNVVPWSVSGTAAVPYNEYVHVAVSYDGANLSVWLNGELDGTIAFGGHPTDTATDVLIGGVFSQNNVVPLLKGVVDEIRIYNRVLTDTELTWLATH